VLATYSTAQKSRLGLYRFIRPVNNPIARLVELYVGEVYGGSLNLKDLSDGAIPIETENDNLRPALVQLYRNSNWQANKSLYVRYGSMLGDSAVKVVDDRRMLQVYLENLHPAKIHTIKRNSAGDIEFVRIEYERGDVNPRTGNYESTYTYAEEIDPDEYRTYKDDMPFDYFTEGGKGRLTSWYNDYGFVPLEVVQHRDMGLGWGATPFSHALGKIDEVNDAWSILNDSVRKAVNIIWFMKARKGTADLEFTVDERDKLPIIYGGADANDPYPMVPNIDITAAGQNIINMQLELERDMPELALHQLRGGGQMTAPGIRAGWSDAIDKIVEARGNYDGGLIRLNKMGVFIGSMMRYPGFEDAQYASLEDEGLEHTIKERAVIEDQLTQKEHLDMLRNLPDKPAQAQLVLETLKVPEMTIKAIVAEIALAQQQKQMQEMQGGFGSNGNAPQLPPGQQAPQAQPGLPPGQGDVESEVQRLLEKIGVAA
jgi:hypothetical protein